MNKPRKRYWLFPVVLALVVIGAYAFVNRDVGQAPPTAEGGIDGTDAGLAAYFDKTCVQLRDLNWALGRLRQNVNSCGWAGNSDCEENRALAGVEWLVRIRQGGVARVTFGRKRARDGNWSVYDFGGMPDCSIHVPEAYGKALQGVPGKLGEAHPLLQHTQGMQLDVLARWLTRDGRVVFVLTHYKDNGVPEDSNPSDKSLQAQYDRQEVEDEARPWALTRVHPN